MLIKWVIVSILVFASVASSAQRDGRDNRDNQDNQDNRDRRDRSYFQINRPTQPVKPAPQVQTAPAVQPVQAPASRVVTPPHTTIMTPTSPNVAPATPVVTTTPTVVEPSARSWKNRSEHRSISGVNRREVRSHVPVVVPSTTTRESSRSERRWSGHQDWRHHSDRDRRGHRTGSFHGTTVFTPFYPLYPYYPYNDYYTRPAYSPNRLFICYEEDQVEEGRFHINCPHPISWYSTYPEYDTAEYRTRYRPEYVCPTYGASYFREFDSSAEATTWWNNYCNTWQSSF